MRVKRFVLPVSVLSVVGFGLGFSALSSALPAAPDQRSVTLSAAQEAASLGFEEQRLALSDGDVTPAEYRGALDDLTACLSRGGLSYRAPVLSPVDGISYIVDVAPPDAKKAAAIDSCAQRYWGLVDQVYVSYEMQVMNPKLLAASSACLADAGFAVTGDETNFPELVADNHDEKRREAAATCVLDEGHRLFPEIATLTVFA